MINTQHGLLRSKLCELFKLDTGAEVTAISEQTFYALLNKFKLIKDSRKIFSGLSSYVQKQHKTSVQQISLVRGLKNNLLELPALDYN